MNSRDKQVFQVAHRRFIRLGRWLLLLVCLAAGLFFLVREKSVGFSILFLLIVLWLLFDNPLESFATLVGSGYQQNGSSHADGQLNLGKETVSEFSESDAFVVDPSDTLDLHTFSPKEIASLLGEFLRQSQKAEIYHVKVIHGKGSGVLRRRVQALLARDRRVLGFSDAPPNSGGWGATVVELRPTLDTEGETAE